MPALSVRGLTKRFGRLTAVDDLSFDVQPGTITGFLGPNGAGKTTTLRMLLGLVHPTAASPWSTAPPTHRLDRPAFTVGAALEATGFHPGRTARNHLRILAHPNGIPSAGSTRCSTRSTSPTPPAAGSAVSRWACGNG